MVPGKKVGTCKDCVYCYKEMVKGMYGRKGVVLSFCEKLGGRVVISIESCEKFKKKVKGGEKDGG